MAKQDMSIEDLKTRINELTLENKKLIKHIQQYTTHQASVATNYSAKEDAEKSLTIIVLGASGDLAKKKTFPSLFSLYCRDMLPNDIIIACYARSSFTDSLFKNQISQKFKAGFDSKKEQFLSRCFYFSGQYDSSTSFESFNTEIKNWETKKTNSKGANRIFYFALPPKVFATVGKASQSCMSKTGWNRIIIEKPFGKDSETSAELSRQLGALFREEQLYRIDHYLGKEMIQNLMVLRFANGVFEPVWDRHSVNCVIISFKEPFGTQGRGGYFDGVGIIRDVMQNHLLQILSLIAMEPPVSMSAQNVRDEKVRLLRCIPPIVLENLVLGQYGPQSSSEDENTTPEPGYIENQDVPNDSVTPTCATAVLYVNNYRWKGVPFILKCGKGLDAKKTDVRIQFKEPPVDIFGDLSPNELVLRVQPNEAVYLKMSMKKPGLKGGIAHRDLDLSYHDRFASTKDGSEKKIDIPGAYERLIYDCVCGEQGNFVRTDELEAAWKIFTPVLHRIENEKIKPVTYKFGSRGPPQSDKLIEKVGFQRTVNYVWKDSSVE